MFSFRSHPRSLLTLLPRSQGAGGARRELGIAHPSQYPRTTRFAMPYKNVRELSPLVSARNYRTAVREASATHPEQIVWKQTTSVNYGHCGIPRGALARRSGRRRPPCQSGIETAASTVRSDVRWVEILRMATPGIVARVRRAGRAAESTPAPAGSAGTRRTKTCRSRAQRSKRATGPAMARPAVALLRLVAVRYRPVGWSEWVSQRPRSIRNTQSLVGSS